MNGGAPVFEDIVWHTPPERPLLARLYRPATAPRAAVVSVHGGRWCAESRLTNAAIDTALAQAGVLVMAIDFRMPPAVRYPQPVADINLAIRWLKARAAGYGVAPEAVGGIGTSSGGHQLLLNVLLPRAAAFAEQPLRDGELAAWAASPAGGIGGIRGAVERAPQPDAALAFAIACWPVSDPLTRYRHALAHDMQLHIDSHHAYWRDEAQMGEGSPQRIVEAGEATHLPPLLMIQGADDTALTPEMPARFAEAYAAAGGAVRLERFAGVGHTFITKAPERAESRAALRTLCAFAAAAGDLAVVPQG